MAVSWNYIAFSLLISYVRKSDSLLKKKSSENLKNCLKANFLPLEVQIFLQFAEISFNENSDLVPS